MSATELITGYYAYQYTFLDDLNFIRSRPTPLEFEQYFSNDGASFEDLLGAVKSKFLEVGWEGDGDVGVIWLPPFVDIGVEDTWGTYVWHVKQRNNGVSFLLSPVRLDFKRLEAQNSEAEYATPQGHPVSIVHHDVQTILHALEECQAQIHQGVDALKSIGDAHAASRLRNDMFAHRQGLLVQALNSFLDDCYLRFLIEAMNGNRAKLKLRKARVHLTPPEFPDDFPETSHEWLTVQSVTSDMWRAYKFEPYKSKLDMLFSSVDFKPTTADVACVAKHICIRNCIQHHEGHAVQDVLGQFGLQALDIRSPKGSQAISRGMIPLYVEELDDFVNAISRLASAFGEHVWNRVPVRVYEQRKN